MGRLAEDDGDLAGAGAQLLAGAQIEGRALPPPVRDADLHRHIAFGSGIRVFRILQIAGGLAVRLVLPTHDVSRFDGLQGTDHLELFIAHGVGVEVIGRLHRDQAQKLHHVVLDHVPDRAGLVVIAAASGHANRLGHRDLHVIDVLRIPQRLEQDIGEPYRHQVLDGFLAQVMVDAIDLLFPEMAGQRGVQRARGFQIAAKGLFNHDAAVLVRDAMAGKAAGDITKQRRRDREVEGMNRTGPHPRFQIDPAAIAPGVDGGIAQQVQELPKARIILTNAAEFHDGIGGLGTEGVVVLVRPCRPDDARGFRYLPCDKAPEQSRQDLAVRQIACGTKDHQIEVIDRNDTRDHAFLLAGRDRHISC